MTSALHGVCHSKGGPPTAPPAEGQCSGFTGAVGCSRAAACSAAVIGDQGYDRDKTRKMLAWQGTTPCTPPRRCRKQPVHDHKRLDRRRHKIETLFSRLKDWQRLTTRYDLCGHVFCSAILLAATVLFW